MVSQKYKKHTVESIPEKMIFQVVYRLKHEAIDANMLFTHSDTCTLHIIDTQVVSFCVGKISWIDFLQKPELSGLVFRSGIKFQTWTKVGRISFLHKTFFGTSSNIFNELNILFFFYEVIWPVSIIPEAASNRTGTVLLTCFKCWSLFQLVTEHPLF